MKHRHTILLMGVSVLICAVLRMVQLVFTIDGTTGFAKPQYSSINLIIGIIIFAAVIGVSALAFFANETKTKKSDSKTVVAGVSMVTGLMFVYQTVVTITQLGKGSGNNILLVLLAFATAITLVAYGLKELLSYDISNMMMVVPVVYYIAKLISTFVSTSALAMVTENIFLIFTNSAVLLFMYHVACFENEMGNVEKTPQKLFTSGVAAFMLCEITALPKLFLIIGKKMQTSYGLVAEVVINIFVGIFILAYILCKFSDSENAKKPASKHSA